MPPFFSTPPALSAHFTQSARPLIMAHRGAPTEQAENTIASFQAAIDAGADVLEMDVHTSADGQLVVIHDDTVDRTSTSQGRVASMTYAELARCSLHEPPGAQASRPAGVPSAQIPLLFDVLRACPDAAFNIDLKAVALPAIAPVVSFIRTLRADGHPHLQVLLTSANAEVQAAIRHASHGEVLLGMGRSDVLAVLKKAWLNIGDVSALHGMAFQAPAYHPVFGIPMPVFTGPVRDLLTTMGSQAHLWRDDGMIDDVHEAQTLVHKGVTGIFTNEVRTMVQHFRAPDAKRRAHP